MKRPGHFRLASVALLTGLILTSTALHAQYDQPATAPGPSQGVPSATARPKAEKLKPAAAPKTAPARTTPTQTTPAAPAATSAPSAAAPSYQPAPELGGPDADSGAIAIPHVVPQPAPLPPPAEDELRNPPGLQHLALRVNSPLVNVDVGVVLEQTHQFVPNLQKSNFEVFENGVPQTITHFSQIQAPITAVLLLEFAETNYQFIYDMQNAAYAFAKQLQPDDEVAVVTYDMHTQILTDFTQDKQRVMDALSTLQMPTWRETNLFDALYTTLDRLARVQGRKYIILVSSGIDSFSKITYDQVLQKIRETPDVTIFSISTGHYARIMAEGFGGMGGMQQIRFLQADNEMQTFARMTGGQYFAPRFETEMPDIFRQINDQIRNQYELSYVPTDRKRDGTYRHIQVRLVNDEGQPLMIVNQKHRPMRYDVIAKEGYRAPLPVQ